MKHQVLFIFQNISASKKKKGGQINNHSLSITFNVI